MSQRFQARILTPDSCLLTPFGSTHLKVRTKGADLLVSGKEDGRWILLLFDWCARLWPYCFSGSSCFAAKRAPTNRAVSAGANRAG